MNETLHQISQVGILAGVFTAMLAIGSHVPLGDILDALRNVRTLALALLANFIVVPLLALLLVRMLPLEVEGKEALILLGATAGAPFLPKLATLAHGHVPFSIGVMVLLMVVTIGYAPLVLPLLLPDATVAPGEIARSLLVIMLLPLLLGLLSRQRYPQVGDWSPELNRISGACLAIGLSAGVLVGWRDLLSTIGSWIVIGTVLLALGAAAIGWTFASGAPLPGEQRAAALATALRNFSAALLVAGQDFGPRTLLMTMSATIVLSIVLIIVAGEMGRRTRTEVARA